jgi:NAD(P)-dependent dehydrogenase (short-subunit alcohol dehydrogenase family)
VTIITGAGSGLGRALSASLAGQGRPVVLVGRREDRLLETRAICVAAGGSTDRCLVVVADVTRRDAAEEVVSRTLLAFGTIAALVNNAGLASFASNERAELDDWYRMFHTNTLAPAAFIKHATPALRKARGVVINIGSIGGLLALPQRAMYGASKAALAHLTRSLARELAPEIRVNAVLPGAIDTDMYDTLGLRESETLELRAEMIRTTPLERMGTVEDVVPWIEVLLGPAGRWVTGSLVVVDGGRSC